MSLPIPSQNAVTGSSGTHPVPEGAADNAPPAIQADAVQINPYENEPPVCPTPSDGAREARTALAGKAAGAIAALRTPDSAFARTPNTVRQSLADLIEEILRASQSQCGVQTEDKEIGKQIGTYLGMSGIDAQDVAFIRALVLSSADQS